VAAKKVQPREISKLDELESRPDDLGGGTGDGWGGQRAEPNVEEGIDSVEAAHFASFSSP